MGVDLIMNNQIAVGSLSDIARRQNISLAESFLSAKIVVLLDTSIDTLPDDADLVVIIIAPLAATAPYKAAAEAPFNKVI